MQAERDVVVRREQVEHPPLPRHPEQDIAVLTGAEVVSEERGRRLDQATVSDLWRARRLESTKDRTTIIEGNGDEAMIKGRIDQINVLIEETTSDYDREKLQERLNLKR